jgi:hypothetical protein
MRIDSTMIRRMLGNKPFQSMNKITTLASAATLIACSYLHAGTTALTNIDHTTNSAGDASGCAFANSFTTGSAASTLDSVSLLVFLDTSMPVTLSIYADNSGSIGSTLIGTATKAFDASGLASQTVTLDFTSTTTMLAANTTYWLVLSPCSEENTLNWYSTSSLANSSLGWATGDGSLKQVTGDTTWDVSHAGTLQFSIDIASVPEPAACAAFLGLGILGFAGFRKMRSR